MFSDPPERKEPSACELRDWTPVTFHINDRPATVEWLPLAGRPFIDPFFDRAVGKFRTGNPQVSPVRTSWETLGRVTEVRPWLRCQGAIFHMSRCGSTLLSNILAAIPRNVVISEAAVINAVLRATDYGHPSELQQRWLDDLIRALGYPRLGIEENYFIKFTSWNVLHLQLICKVLPRLRWVFVYRNPIEVMVSVLRSPPGWMEDRARNPVLGPQKLVFTANELLSISDEEYCARTLACLFDVALTHHSPDTLLLNYHQLFDSFLPELLTFYGIQTSCDEIVRMTAARRFYSKDSRPLRVFRDDSAEKQREASSKLRAMANKWVMDRYVRLEDLRKQQANGRAH
jgi:hypothetical protein